MQFFAALLISSLMALVLGFSFLELKAQPSNQKSPQARRSPTIPAPKPNSWGFDEAHCKAMFTCNHDGIAPVTGWFNKVIGGVTYDGKDLKAAKIYAYIETSSINSGLFARDFHLKSENFFDVTKYTLMKFESTSIKPLSPGKFQMAGTLEIKGIKKPIVLDCLGPNGPVIEEEKKQKRIGFTAKTSINRKDFGINWNREVSKGVFMVGDKVDIALEIELVKL